VSLVSAALGSRKGAISHLDRAPCPLSHVCARGCVSGGGQTCGSSCFFFLRRVVLQYRHVFVEAPKIEETFQNLRLSTATGEQSCVHTAPASAPYKGNALSRAAPAPRPCRQRASWDVCRFLEPCCAFSRPRPQPAPARPDSHRSKPSCFFPARSFLTSAPSAACAGTSRATPSSLQWRSWAAVAPSVFAPVA
jgi:hypothetical protein